ncbi:MAG: hypothetical protein WKF60_05230 [Ilumatobacter sp.]
MSPQLKESVRRSVNNAAGHFSDGVSDPVLERSLGYLLVRPSRHV